MRARETRGRRQCGYNRTALDRIVWTGSVREKIKSGEGRSRHLPAVARRLDFQLRTFYFPLPEYFPSSRECGVEALQQITIATQSESPQKTKNKASSICRTQLSDLCRSPVVQESLWCGLPFRQAHARRRGGLWFILAISVLHSCSGHTDHETAVSMVKGQGHYAPCDSGLLRMVSSVVALWGLAFPSSLPWSTVQHG